MLVPALPWVPIGPFIDSVTPTDLAFGVVPMLLAPVAAGWSIGGRWGIVIGAALLALVAYWSWWFSLGSTHSIARFEFDDAVSGLITASDYLSGILTATWPIVLGLVLVVALIARRLRLAVWTSIGVFALQCVVFSFPGVGTWDDGCNDASGPTPLITQPATEELMDLGIGVLPRYSLTQAQCVGQEELTWKPFWQGGDGIPERGRRD